MLKITTMLLTLIFAQCALADCKDFSGTYKSDTKPAQVIRLNQSGCKLLTYETNDALSSLNPLELVFDGSFQRKKAAAILNGKPADVTLVSLINDNQITSYFSIVAADSFEAKGQIVLTLGASGNLEESVIVEGATPVKFNYTKINTSVGQK